MERSHRAKPVYGRIKRQTEWNKLTFPLNLDKTLFKDSREVNHLIFFESEFGYLDNWRKKPPWDENFAFI